MHHPNINMFYFCFGSQESSTSSEILILHKSFSWKGSFIFLKILWLLSKNFFGTRIFLTFWIHNIFVGRCVSQDLDKPSPNRIFSFQNPDKFNAGTTTLCKKRLRQIYLSNLNFSQADPGSISISFGKVSDQKNMQPISIENTCTFTINGILQREEKLRHMRFWGFATDADVDGNIEIQ